MSRQRQNDPRLSDATRARRKSPYAGQESDPRVRESGYDVGRELSPGRGGPAVGAPRPETEEPAYTRIGPGPRPSSDPRLNDAVRARGRKR
jgi:hypothetical protein